MQVRRHIARKKDIRHAEIQTFHLILPHGNPDTEHNKSQTMKLCGKQEPEVLLILNCNQFESGCC